MLNGTAGKLYGSAAYRHFSSAAFTKINDDASSDDANLWSVGAGYKFDRNWNLSGAYAKNTEADTDATAHNIQLNYKGAQTANKGSWAHTRLTATWARMLHLHRSMRCSSRIPA